MPHSRPRHLIPVLLKRLRFSPVIALQGPRQVGKSFLIRELLSKELPAFEYRSLDRLKDRDFALTNPETFLKQFSDQSLLAIDEAQKAPPLFDAIKFEVDQDRRPGRYLLLGSTEFSKQTLIRESLAGRMARIRLYPMNLAETLALDPGIFEKGKIFTAEPRASRKQLLDYLKNGGMPGIFAVRNSDERQALQRDWLETTVSRDLLQFPKLKLDPDLALRILEVIATSESPDAGSIAKTLRQDLRRIRTHLSALESLFVLNRLEPHPSGTGKTIYLIFDVGFARLLGADFERQLHTWALQEELSRRGYAGDRETKLHYYRTPKGRVIQLIETHAEARAAAIQIFSEEALLSRDLELLRAFRTKVGKGVDLFGLGAGDRIESDPKIRILPWESLA